VTEFTPRTSRRPIDDYLAHATFHARESPSGIGAAVVRAVYEHGERSWDSVVSDCDEWHYVRVVGADLGPFPNISAEDVEQGIARFAVTLPAQHRIRHLLNANPLHIDRHRNVHD
jgi:hypothetical protein